MDIVRRRRAVSLPVLPVAACGRIQGSEVGVLVNYLTGNIDGRTEPGARIHNGLITDLLAIDNSLQTIEMVEAKAVNIKTVGGADGPVDVLVQPPVQESVPATDTP